jgi:hypothetical protein
MDQRREPRLAAEQPVLVTVLGKHEMMQPAKVRDASDRGLGLEMAIPVPTGAALKIEFEDSILLGEAVFCRDEEGSYFVGVELEQALRGLCALDRTLREFAEEASGVEHAYAVKHRSGQNHQQSQKQQNGGPLRHGATHQIAMKNPPHI